MRLVIAVLVIVSILALAATLGTIIVGTRSFEGIVVDKPYEAGLAFDEKEQQKSRLGWKVAVEGTQFRTGENELLIRAADGNGRPLANASVTVTVSRPSTRDYDKTYPSVRHKDGLYHALVVFPLYGAWDVAIEVIRNNDHVVYQYAVFADEIADDRAGPTTHNKTLCNIQAGSCSREIAGGLSVVFDILPKPVSAMSELTFSVALTRHGKPISDASSVILDLSMPGMFMGKNRHALKKLGDVRYEGRGIITRCMSGRKTWQAKVTVVHDGKTSLADFVFEVK